MSVGLIASIHIAGLRGRSFQERAVVSVAAVRDAYRIMKEKGGKGRTVLCFSLHSRSTAIDDGRFMPYGTFPLYPSELLPFFVKNLSRENILWVLMQEGVVRKVIYAVPGGEWQSISKRITGSEAARPPIDLGYRGSAIMLYPVDRLPKIREKAILFIDSSVSDIPDLDLPLLIKKEEINYDLAVYFTDGETGK